jgi:Mg2+/Co2+ transporter CorB
MITIIQLLIIIFCMVGAAFFSGMETGVISIHRMRLRHLVRQGSGRAKILQHFLQNPDKLLGSTLVGTNTCVVIISIMAASLAALEKKVLIVDSDPQANATSGIGIDTRKITFFVGMLMYGKSLFRPPKAA